jgi:Fic family protein
MNLKEYKAGKWLSGLDYKYFLPEQINHPLSWDDSELTLLLEDASRHLGELNAFARFVPDLDLFIQMHVLKEAVVSSRIEGTQTRIEDALMSESEIDPEKRNDWQEVQNYTLALNFALNRLKEIPLSTRLLKETHAILMQNVRGENKQPGGFRRSQNWIGGATVRDAVFVPPAHTEVSELMSDLEKFLHNQEIQIPHLIRIALAHYQFETIHPFLDGNGRTGRIIIPLYLVSNGILEKPILYLSDFFEQNRQVYYDKLSQVRLQNDLKQWLVFFLIGTRETAKKGVSTLQSIMELQTRMKGQVMDMGKRVKSAHRLLNLLFSKPVITINEAKNLCDLSFKSANDLIQIFHSRGWLNEVTGYQRNRVFIFKQYLDLFQ